MKKLRLVKVVVHPILLVDDGEHLTHFDNSPSEIPAAEWAGFHARLAADIADAEAAINAEDGP